MYFREEMTAAGWPEVIPEGNERWIPMGLAELFRKATTLLCGDDPCCKGYDATSELILKHCGMTRLVWTVSRLYNSDMWSGSPFGIPELENIRNSMFRDIDSYLGFCKTVDHANCACCNEAAGRVEQWKQPLNEVMHKVWHSVIDPLRIPDASGENIRSGFIHQLRWGEIGDTSFPNLAAFLGNQGWPRFLTKTGVLHWLVPFWTEAYRLLTGTACDARNFGETEKVVIPEAVRSILESPMSSHILADEKVCRLLDKAHETYWLEEPNPVERIHTRYSESWLARLRELRFLTANWPMQNEPTGLLESIRITKWRGPVAGLFVLGAIIRPDFDELLDRSEYLQLARKALTEILLTIHGISKPSVLIIKTTPVIKLLEQVENYFLSVTPSDAFNNFEYQEFLDDLDRFENRVRSLGVAMAAD